MWDDVPEHNTPQDPAEWSQDSGTSGAEPHFHPDQEPLPFPPLPLVQQEMFAIPEPPPRLRRVPNLGDVVLFFVMALVLLGIGQLVGVFVLQATHIFPRRGFDSLFILSSTDARISIPIQAFAYGLIALVSVPVFTVLWNQPFGDGVHWNNPAALSRFFRLAILGLAVGAAISMIGNFLPMPKNPPITQDMMKSSAGAWMMLVFGLTAAPLLEELAFRGFLLPGFINLFRWFGARLDASEQTADRIGVPIAIALTSIAFAFMHSPQVSHAWGPLILIGFVSIVLCVVRLMMNSVAAGVIVHAAYNFTLFAGVLYQTGGFRHLDRLT